MAPGRGRVTEARPDSATDRTALEGRLEKLAFAARAALLWERVWPVLASLLVVLGLFLTVSWLGLWLETPRWLRIAGGLFFLLLALAALAQGFRLRWPGRSEALSRLDRDSGLAHRPATTLADAPANAANDPEVAALWALHAFSGLVFAAAQTGASLIAMTSNFFLNNALTYRDRRLTGRRLVLGLVSLYDVCSAGMLANVGAASYMFGEAKQAWWVAGFAGVVIGSVWNYAMTSLLTWRK